MASNPAACHQNCNHRERARQALSKLALLQTMSSLCVRARLHWTLVYTDGSNSKREKIVVLARSVSLLSKVAPPRPDQSSRGNRGQQPLLVGVHGARSSADC